MDDPGSEHMKMPNLTAQSGRVVLRAQRVKLVTAMTETVMKGGRRPPTLSPSLCTHRATATSRSSGRNGEHEDEDEKKHEEQQDSEQNGGDSGEVTPSR
jgi:hypothetical protein